MEKRDSFEIGSSTAKGGFKNEKDVAAQFNNWKHDRYSRKWLEVMGYNLKTIEKVFAIVIPREKTDVQVQIFVLSKNKAIGIENISVKLVSNTTHGFNQIDKRWVRTYTKLWNMPNKVSELLELYTGQKRPNRSGLVDQRRLNLNEMADQERASIINFFSKNKILVLSDILKGRGKFSASWMLVIAKSGEEYRWALRDINEAMNIFGDGSVNVTNRGVLKIGRITMQRKGGDRGRLTANMLQFKANPLDLFEKHR